MAALRVVRQHLASRAVDPDRGLYAYRLTDHGHARVAFLEDDGPTQPRESEARAASRRPLSANGVHLMKRTKTHTGTFHCPSCFTEVELIAEESLKCDTCKGPLAPGSLDEIWADEEAED